LWSKASLDDCGFVFRVRNPQLGDNPPLESALYDLAVQSLLSHKSREAAAPPSNPLPSIKF